MSVLIKGMDMPLCCQQCPLCADEGRFCMAARRCIPIVGRIDWCPLIKILPHGRLIDADAFEANMQNEWEHNEISNSEWIHFREMINAEPTIIEAEE